MSAYYVGIALDSKAKTVYVASLQTTWDEAYRKCKEQYPDLPCCCCDWSGDDPQETGDELFRFFRMNGHSDARATQAVRDIAKELANTVKEAMAGKQ